MAQAIFFEPTAGEASQRTQEDLAVLSAWGRAIRPVNPETLAAPPPEIEADVQLLCCWGIWAPIKRQHKLR